MIRGFALRLRTLRGVITRADVELAARQHVADGHEVGHAFGAGRGHPTHAARARRSSRSAAPSVQLRSDHGCLLRHGISLARRSRQRALPDRVADEERPERLEYCEVCTVLRMRLDEVRERVQLLAHEADHEVVVVDVEAVAREADVVGEVGVAVGAADARCARG